MTPRQSNTGSWVGELDDVEAGVDEIAPYRRLLAEILSRAMEDLGIEVIRGNRGKARDAEAYDAKLDAYTWIVQRDQWYLRICEHLDLEPERIRTQIIHRCGQECEDKLRRRALMALEASRIARESREAMALRHEADKRRKADLARQRAIRSQEAQRRKRERAAAQEREISRA